MVGIWIIFRHYLIKLEPAVHKKKGKNLFLFQEKSSANMCTKLKYIFFEIV